MLWEALGVGTAGATGARCARHNSETVVVTRASIPYRWRNWAMANCWGVLFLKWKFSFENNLRIKQHNFHRRCPIVLSKNFVCGPCEGRLGTIPGPALKLPPVEVNYAYVARGYTPLGDEIKFFHQYFPGLYVRCSPDFMKLPKSLCSPYL